MLLKNYSVLISKIKLYSEYEWIALKGAAQNVVNSMVEALPYKKKRDR